MHNRFSNVGIWQRDWEPTGNLTLEASGIWLQNCHRTGKQTLGGHKQNLVCTRTRRKEQWSHNRLNQSCLWVSRSVRQRHELTVACCGVKNTDRNSPGSNNSDHQQKTALKIYWAWPRPSEQDPDSPTTSPSHQEASTSLLSLSIRGQKGNHNYRRLTKLIIWITALSNAMKL